MKHFGAPKKPQTIKCLCCGFTMRLHNSDIVNTGKRYKPVVDEFYGCTNCEMAVREAPSTRTKSKTTLKMFV